MLSGMRKTYPIDLSDKEWARLKTYFPTAKLLGRLRVLSLRDIFTGQISTLLTPSYSSVTRTSTAGSCRRDWQPADSPAPWCARNRLRSAKAWQKPRRFMNDL